MPELSLKELAGVSLMKRERKGIYPEYAGEAGAGKTVRGHNRHVYQAKKFGFYYEEKGQPLEDFKKSTAMHRCLVIAKLIQGWTGDWNEGKSGLE